MHSEMVANFELMKFLFVPVSTKNWKSAPFFVSYFIYGTLERGDDTLKNLKAIIDRERDELIIAPEIKIPLLN